MQFLCVKSDTCVYITRNVTNSDYPSNFGLNNYRFNGEPAEPTFRRDWFKIASIGLVEKFVPPQKEYGRYVLKDIIPITDKTPGVIELVPQYYSDDLEEMTQYPEHLMEIKSLYELKWDMTEPSWEPIEVEWITLAEMNGFQIVPIEHRLKHRMIDEITVHPVLLPTKPCEISSEESFKIIRAFIKANINPKVARMTSDYDFCLTVEKFIDLKEKESYTVDLNNDLFSKRKKKPNIVTRFRTNRQMVVYKTAPNRPQKGVYDGYPMTPGFKGESYDDMVANIEKFLADLIEDINTPLQDCPTCNGHGVVKI